MAANTIYSNEKMQPLYHERSLLVPGRLVIGALFLVALIAFEIFNFDTTRYALESFLGTTSFAGVSWAAVLAIAFCAIDFAGLLRFFLPEDEQGNMPVEVWYLMGAWLLGATMNALMTWWAVNLTLLNHNFGNEVLSRQQLLEIVPAFVAVLVWLTRILFIGAFTVAGGYLFKFNGTRAAHATAQQPVAAPAKQPLVLRRKSKRIAKPGIHPVSDDVDEVPDVANVPPFLRRAQRDVMTDDELDELADELAHDDVETMAREHVSRARGMRRPRPVRRPNVPVPVSHEQEG